MQEWIYENDYENSIRYVLGTVGSKTLYCFGINPSTAVPNDLDPTVEKVEKIALYNGYDSWMMFNVYPKRNTNFDDLPETQDDIIHKKNIKMIRKYFKDNLKISVWLAYGDLIYDREYLPPCLKDIYNNIKEYNISWLATGTNQSGSPTHPLYQKDKSILTNFNMEDYIKTL